MNEFGASRRQASNSNISPAAAGRARRAISSPPSRNARVSPPEDIFGVLLVRGDYFQLTVESGSP